ncbi:unnamed protein product [Auanema sp. JU1783]|nr:unnamed protein product [Auanema sp. JU1783]
MEYCDLSTVRYVPTSNTDAHTSNFFDVQPSTSTACLEELEFIHTVEETPSIEKDDYEDDYYEYYYQMKDNQEDILKKLEEQLRETDSEQAKLEEELLSKAEELITEHKAESKNQELLKSQSEELRKQRQELQRLKAMFMEASRTRKIFCCFICSKAFGDEESCRQHVSNVHLKDNEVYAFKCKYCYMRFKKPHHQRRHEKTHARSVSGYFSCDQCPDIFKEERSLAYHKSSMHSQDLHGAKIEKKFDCSCGKKFGLEGELKRHKYYCENKDAILERRRTAKVELVVGSPQLSPAESLASSVVRSLGGRPVKDKSCPFCHQVCASVQSRNRHIERKHSDKKNDQEAVTVKYTRIESPDLPFCCVVCNNRFATQAALSLHKRRIHDQILSYECSQCNKKYPIASELRKHVKRVHNGDNIF